jgi:hypothetical protein
MGTHILHGRLAAWTSGSLLFLGLFSKSKHDGAPFDSLLKDVDNRNVTIQLYITLNTR